MRSRSIVTAVPLLTTSVVVSAEVDDKPFDVVLAADEREEFWTSWEEEEVLLDAFRELGRNVTRVRFADDRFDWSSAKMVLVRGLYAAPSYGFEYDDFLDKLENETVLVNPRGVVDFDREKNVFLDACEDAGVNVPKSIYLDSLAYTEMVDAEEEVPTLERIQSELGCDDMVLKLSSGTGTGEGVWRVTDDNMEEMEEVMADVLWGYHEEVDGAQNMLVQCFMESVLTKGERELIVIGGQVVDSIVKIPARGDFRVNADQGGRVEEYIPTNEESELALNVYSTIREIIGDEFAYMTIEMAYDNEGQLALTNLATAAADLQFLEKPENAKAFALYVSNLLDQRGYTSRVSYSKPSPVDVVAVTDDANYYLGAEEDWPLLRSLQCLGRSVARVSLHDSRFDWDSPKMVIIRSAWDKYYFHQEYLEFLDKIDKSDAIMVNPNSIIKWQAAKSRYLKDLANAGINMADTRFIAQTRTNVPKLVDLAKELGCNDVVFKPAAGNGGVGVVRVNVDDPDAQDSFAFMIGADDGLVQCFARQIKTKGERGLVFVGGQVTEGVLKLPAEHHFLVHEQYSGTTQAYEPSVDEIEFAKNVAATVKEIVGEYPAYLRVDIFYDNDDNIALMELAAGTANLSMAKNQRTADVLALYLDTLLREKESKHASRSKVTGDGSPMDPVVNNLQVGVGSEL